MNKTLPKWIAVGGVSLLMSLGCKTTMPSENLVDARQAYQRAESSEAKKLAPAALQEAKAALAEAEEAFADDPGSTREKDLAYIAHRKSLRAIARGDEAKHERAAAKAKEDEDELLRKQRDVAEMSLAETKRELQDMERKGAELSEKLKDRQKELEQHKEDLRRAKERAEAAVESLRKIAKVKQQQQQLVITLSGAVLFEFGKSKLLPAAQRKLNDVAKALQQQDPNKTITVEGHTDSIGTEQRNEELSLSRAQSVRDYLVSQGVKPDRIEAVGRGEAEPIASNDTPEGRANNRRVEIIVGKGSA